MPETPLALITLVVGVLIVASTLLKEAGRRVGFPGVVAFLLVGVVLGFVDAEFDWMGDSGRYAITFLGNLGIFALLFRVGLESDIETLAKYLRRATPVWLGNMVVSGGAAYLFARYGLEYGLIPSLFTAGALTATSVGVSVTVWEEADQLTTPAGQLLVDVAEMDDLSGVVVMGLLLAIAPVVHAGNNQGLPSLVLSTTGWFFLKLVVFAAGCYAFSKHVEPKMTNWFASFERAPNPMISVVGVGLVIASIAGLMGFSIAIGGFFAGLTYSRDPKAVHMDADFSTLYNFLTPFFFIQLGLQFNPSSLSGAVVTGSVLLLAAVGGKLAGSELGGLMVEEWTPVLSVSMVPRAEIALVIMEQGHELGDWAVPDELFSAMILVSAMTCLVVPFVVRHQLSASQSEVS